MFGDQRSRLALLRTLGAVALAALAGAVVLAASQAGAVSRVGPPDPSLPPDCQRAVAFDPAQFRRPTRISNRFLPLVPGTQLVLEGRANRGGGPLPHRVTFTVTDLVKVINGVSTRVMWDVDENEGEVVEAELAFFAQDNHRNVWNFGEYPEEYEDGFFIGAPNTWIAGVADAEAGIHMLAWPEVGNTYLQGLAPQVEFLDCARVHADGQSTCVPAGCFNNVLVTHERSPLDPAGGVQTKAHAPGVGIVEVGALDDPEGETLVLAEVVQLDEAGLAQARDEALKLDQRAYRASAEVYGETPPLSPLPPPQSPTDPPPGAVAAPVAGAPGAAAAPAPAPAAPAAPTTTGKAKSKSRKRVRRCTKKRGRHVVRRGPRRRATDGPKARVRQKQIKRCKRRPR